MRDFSYDKLSTDIIVIICLVIVCLHFDIIVKAVGILTIAYMLYLYKCAQDKVQADDYKESDIEYEDKDSIITMRFPDDD